MDNVGVAQPQLSEVLRQGKDENLKDVIKSQACPILPIAFLNWK